MHEVELLVILLAVTTALAEVANRMNIPYPVVLVLAGLGLSLLPGLPPVSLAPNLVFFVFLPPLLFASAWQLSWSAFRAELRPISMLAIGCVLFSLVFIAAVTHYLLPGFGWGSAFVLAAIISPTDAVSAAVATKGLPISRRIISILEGESLVNDATGLIAYRYAVAAVVTGQFALGAAAGQLVLVAGVGIVVGLVVGFVFYVVHRLSRTSVTVDTSLSLLTPYAAYLVAETAHGSGVLAVVVSALFVSQYTARIFNHEGRLQVLAVWDSLTFLLNGLVFILIGLQLPAVLDGVAPDLRWPMLGYGLLVSVAIIGARMLWAYPTTYLTRLLGRFSDSIQPGLSVKEVTLVSWGGMRGVLSLAAALALPLTLPSGAAFPQRNPILLLTFIVILVSLLVQGLTLRPLIGWLGLEPDTQAEREEQEVRISMAHRTVEYLSSPEAAGQAPPEIMARMQHRYAQRLERLRLRTNSPEDVQPATLTPFQQLQEVLIHFERGVLDNMRKERHISEEVLRKLENELDLEEGRLALDKAQ
ncbi:Na+/H+ antiporter [Hymenobacter sp. H14-R3]|uniref:Na+/H+ antiporter n=1 Tax=Hymenobacter sp. H14-R3 TaxID=3046308 RepID=UPI0024B8EE74|nr:Na+/H+ antiporter [Hymenobacter sp. H14-R3]MDJ0364996.1 Na+/H+ antiporter [Hymenobacter sp. H14-R3]